MTTMRCSVYDEGLDAQCAMRAQMVRTVIKDGEFPTCAYYCQEHGAAHGAVVIDLAEKIRQLHVAAVKAKDEALVNACGKALLGEEQAFNECLEAVATPGKGAAR